MFSGIEFVDTLRSLSVSHVVWLPDATTGVWHRELSSARELSLVSVCREGEAWGIAAGLYLGGKRPFIVIQNTGLFESGDAMRNVLFDLGLPLYAMVGNRNALVRDTKDTARRFTEPILNVWGLDYIALDGDAPLEQLGEHFRHCQAALKPGVALLPEGRG